MKKQKYKISRLAQTNVIVVVLLVLVAIMAASALGYFIVKFVKEKTAIDNVKLELVIDSTKEKPCFNPDTFELKVYIKRLSGDANLTSIKLIATYSSGESVSLTNSASLAQLESNEYTLYGLEPTPLSIQIAPIVSIGGKNRTLKFTDNANVVSSTTCFSSGSTLSSVNLDSSSSPGGVSAPPLPAGGLLN